MNERMAVKALLEVGCCVVKGGWQVYPAGSLDRPQYVVLHLDENADCIHEDEKWFDKLDEAVCHFCAKARLGG